MSLEVSVKDLDQDHNSNSDVTTEGDEISDEVHSASASDSGQESSEEELDEDEGDSDELIDTELLLEQVENTFKNLLDQKISATESVFDHVNLPHHGGGAGVSGGSGNANHAVDDTDSKSFNALFDGLENLLIRAEEISRANLDLQGQDKRSTTRCESTQTDFDDLRINNSITENGIEIEIDGEQEANESGKLKILNLNCNLVVKSEKARGEISTLRDIREVFIDQRKELADIIKKSTKDDNEDPQNEKKLYELEESIEAIDSAIEFKNEIICGREFVAFQRNEEELMEKLRNLSLKEVQRLFCKYFAKVIELRYSSKRLEYQTDEIESNCEKMSKTIASQNKQIEEIENACKTRIKSIIALCNDDPENPNKELVKYVHGLDKKLAAAKKKQSDLERSLTELLVRHGYLFNGLDYDVKTVVKMLGIDTKQMGLNWKEYAKESSRHTSRRPGISYHGSRRNSGIPHQSSSTTHRSHHHRPKQNNLLPNNLPS